jgi:hypothetical protein
METTLPGWHRYIVQFVPQRTARDIEGPIIAVSFKCSVGDVTFPLKNPDAQVEHMFNMSLDQWESVYCNHSIDDVASCWKQHRCLV